MDTKYLQLAVVVIALIGLYDIFKRIRGRKVARMQKAIETPTVLLVKQRRNLSAALLREAGSEQEAFRLVSAEARRMGLTTANVDVLDAAIQRAKEEKKPTENDGAISYP